MTRLLEPALPGAPTEREAPPRHASHTEATQPREFRPDIEGLRAFAVLAVVLYHADLGVRGGFVGVDVFFVISGFLITRQLLSSVGRSGIRALPGFYTRRIRRLLPAAAVVVAATVLAARFWAPPLQVRSITIDGIFTTFYGLNYHLAIEGTQYLHENDAVSPLQHFWSLAVEEQFYVVWPIVIVLASVIGRRLRKPLLLALLIGITVISLGYSITTTEHLASWAYFSLHTRAWELALGALVAMAASRLCRLPRALLQPAAWLGLAAVIASAFIYTANTPYPGAYAALPVGGAALLIACGCGPRCSAERILAEPMLQCIGRVSYAWYLWHWPMLILAPMALNHPLDAFARGVVVWLSLVAAIISYFVVEDPGRRKLQRTWQGFAAGFALSGAVLATGVLVLANLPSFTGSGGATHVVQAASASTQVDREMQAALTAGIKITDAPRNLTPDVQDAAHDLPAADGTSCHASFTTIKQGPCVYGDPHGQHTAVLLGDSHADMWLGAFDRAGKSAHWRIIDWTKSSCPAARITVYNSSLKRTYTECDTWRADVLKRIAALRPDLVIVSDSENVVDASVSPQTWSSDTLATLQQVRASSGAKVVLMQDIPVPAHDLPSCVAAHLNSVTDCTFATSKAHSFPARHRQLAADAKRAHFEVVEPEPWICVDDRCPAIVGNMLVYRDDTHLTATFSAWLAPRVAPLLTVG